MEEDFHQIYKREYTYCLDFPIEIVGIHTIATADIGKLDIKKVKNILKKDFTKVVAYDDLHAYKARVLIQKTAKKVLLRKKLMIFMTLVHYIILYLMLRFHKKKDFEMIKGAWIKTMEYSGFI